MTGSTCRKGNTTIVFPSAAHINDPRPYNLKQFLVFLSFVIMACNIVPFENNKSRSVPLYNFRGKINQKEQNIGKVSWNYTGSGDTYALYRCVCIYIYITNVRRQRTTTGSGFPKISVASWGTGQPRGCELSRSWSSSSFVYSIPDV